MDKKRKGRGRSVHKTAADYKMAVKGFRERG